MGAGHSSGFCLFLFVCCFDRNRLPLRPCTRAGGEVWWCATATHGGAAAGSRQSAGSGDVTPDFPAGWRAQGHPGDTFHAGARPLSEPESRLLARLVRRLRPSATIWYHQALALVDLGTVADRALVRRYAAVGGLPARRLGFLPGVATRWQDRLVRGGSALVVKRRSGRLGARGAARQARAVSAVARYLVAVRSM